MSLSPGTRLGGYEIVSPLGAGGMGEVYRARDPRLARDVAIKVLPEDFLESEEGRKRFEREARALASLNHPNVAAIHSFEEVPGSSPSASRHILVMELLEGATLRERLDSGPIAQRQVVDFALQIAKGLSAAHEKGIVHRDLKPENLFVSKDGHLKILDFGLARRTELAKAGDETSAATEAKHTEPGVVMGTVAYMSPEQASGQPLDFRSDQFSFGSILYEMASGRKAFARKTAAETMSAIIREEPEPLVKLRPDVAPPLRWFVERCLAKDPEERYASTRDLERELAGVRDHLSEAGVSGEASTALPPRSRRRLWPALMGVALLIAVGFAAFSLGQRSGKISLPSFRRLTFRRGYVFSARFAPDGHTVVYGASWDGKPVQLYSTHPGSPESLPFSLPSADVLSISPSGELALSLGRHFMDFWETMGTLAQVPISGNAPREVLENVVAADWAPDGVNLAVVRKLGPLMSLEFPIGNRLYETSGWISHPRVSPGGDAIAFIDHPVLGDDTGSLALVDRSGRRRALSEQWNSAQGVAWSPSGKEIWFTAAPVALIRTLHSVSLAGRKRVIAEYAGTLHDISRDGKVLLARDSVRARMVVLPRGETHERDLSWLDSSVVSDISADGKMLFFAEEAEGGGGAGTVYVRKTDGSPPVRLSEGYPFALSDDKRWALATPIGHTQLTLLPTGAGQARPLERGPIESYQSAKFLPDGKRILFAGSERARRARLYVQDLTGGDPRPVTPEGAGAGFRGIVVSPDGRFATGPATSSGFARYPLEGGSPLPIEGLAEGEFPVQWSADGKSLYVYRLSDVPARVFLLDLSTGRRELWKELTPPDPAGTNVIYTVQIAPDGKAYAYTYGQLLSDLYLVEGLK